MSNCSTDKHECCGQDCGCIPAENLTTLHAHDLTRACSDGAPACEAPIDEEESGCGCSSCGCHSHEHDHDHGSGNDKRELLLMGVSAVLFAIGMLADKRMAQLVGTARACVFAKPTLWIPFERIAAAPVPAGQTQCRHPGNGNTSFPLGGLYILAPACEVITHLRLGCGMPANHQHQGH